MGLSASQARLLTITSRKSDCEFQSMRYSHEKIALSRNMTDISNEYQNSLNQTKLVYDFYGTNDRTTPLSYALMMEPSIMNNYMPMLSTNTAGKVVLDSKLAAAAKAAGIPSEGLGTLPAQTVRNKFLQGLYDYNVITNAQKENYMNINYNQNIGNGNIDPIQQNVTTKVSYTDLLNMFGTDDFAFSYQDFSVNNGEKIQIKAKEKDGANGNDPRTYINSDDDSGSVKFYDMESQESGSTSTYYDISKSCFVSYSDINANSVNNSQLITLKDILEGNYEYYGRIRYNQGTGFGNSYKQYNNGHIEYALMQEISNCEIWDKMMSMFESALGVDNPASEMALQYAMDETKKLYDFDTIINSNSDNSGKYNGIAAIKSYWAGGHGTVSSQVNNRSDKQTVFGQVAVPAKDYIGYYIQTTNTQYSGTYPSAKTYEAVAINVSNIARAFLTYYAEAMTGFEDPSYKVDNSSCRVTDYEGDGDPITEGGVRTVADSRLIGQRDKDGNVKNTSFTFDVVTDTSVNTGDALISSFYDAMFNQICQRGWVENDKVRDNDYLQEMYKNGMMFLTTCTDDGFYWQGNYSANSYIKEVTDEDAIARAEAKYNTEKQKINHKEEIIDLKMKNLDTEISSLSTEYDTIKSLISKNIERGFKRYEA